MSRIQLAFRSRLSYYMIRKLILLFAIETDINMPKSVISVIISGRVSHGDANHQNVKYDISIPWSNYPQKPYPSKPHNVIPKKYVIIYSLLKHQNVMKIILDYSLSSNDEKQNCVLGKVIILE